jgi:anaerobic magnesium-protoporphyrin IX monomethyl ester cyclase
VALVALNRPGHQSLGLAYVRAYAEAHERLRGKVAFQTLDLDTDADAWWLAYRILRMQPDVLGISATCWNADKLFEACEIVRSAAPSIKIIAGGPEVGPIAEEVLAANPAIDMVVRGEGEETFAELLRVLLTGKRPWMCPGVTARNGALIVSAPDRPVIDDLDTIPSPYLSGVLVPSGTLPYIETFRGCPHACAYCYEAKGTTTIRSFSRERVEAEITNVATTPGVEAISFVDTVFNLTNERLAWLSGVLAPHAERGLRLHTVEVDVERIGDEEARLLRRAGVVTVETGPQTIGEQALETSHRRFDPQRFVSAVHALKAAGISVECDLIIGLPGDDAYDVIAGLRWLFSLDPGIVQSSTLRVLPGTDFACRASDLSLTSGPRSDHAVVQTEQLSFADIRRLETLANATQNAYRARL